LFKWIKQNLKVKTFVGTSQNALLIQIWTALIAILLLKWMHHLSKANWSFSNLASLLRMNLFTYRDLRRWLDQPSAHRPKFHWRNSSLLWPWADWDRQIATDPRAGRADERAARCPQQ